MLRLRNIAVTQEYALMIKVYSSMSGILNHDLSVRTICV